MRDPADGSVRAVFCIVAWRLGIGLTAAGFVGDRGLAAGYGCVRHYRGKMRVVGRFAEFPVAGSVMVVTAEMSDCRHHDFDPTDATAGADMAFAIAGRCGPEAGVQCLVLRAGVVRLSVCLI